MLRSKFIVPFVVAIVLLGAPHVVRSITAQTTGVDSTRVQPLASPAPTAGTFDSTSVASSLIRRLPPVSADISTAPFSPPPSSVRTSASDPPVAQVPIFEPPFTSHRASTIPSLATTVPYPSQRAAHAAEQGHDPIHDGGANASSVSTGERQTGWPAAGPVALPPTMFAPPKMHYGPQGPPAPTYAQQLDSLWISENNEWGGAGGAYEAPTYGYPAANGASQCTSGCRGLCSCDSGAPRTWLRAEFLFGWLSGYRTPALLVDSPLTTPASDLSDDRVIFGDSRFGRDVRVGGRLTGGYWFDDCRKVGIQAEAFTIGNDDDEINLASNGDPFISRPFFNTNPAVDAPDTQVIALDGLALGRFRTSTTGRLVSAAPALRWNVDCCGGLGADGQGSCRLDLIGGYRYTQLREGFIAVETLRPQNGTFAAGSSYTLDDAIDTQNDFHGFELGGILMRQSGPWTTEMRAMAAFGTMDRKYQLNGSTTLFVPNNLNTTFPGGFLVRPEDIGTYSESEFTVIPQFRANLSYAVRENVKLTMGYSFLHMNNVFRPGLLMATTFDGGTLGEVPAAGVAGSAQPKTAKTDAFMNSLSFGATYSF